ncbi:MAG: DUF6049 family protein [Ilumatobacteraceae bacterium]
MKSMMFKSMMFVTTMIATVTTMTPMASAGEGAVVEPSIGVLVSQDEFVAGIEGSVLHATVSVRDLPTDDSASIAITSYRPVKTRSGVRDAIAGKLPGVVDTVIIASSTIPRDQSGYLELSVPIEIGVRSRANLQMSAVGLYPISIGIVIDKTVVDQIVTFVDRLPEQTSTPEQTEPLQVAVVTGLDGPIARQPDFTSTIDAASLVTSSNMVTAIEDLDMTPLTVSASPQWIDALAQDGAEGVPLLERLGVLQSIQFLSRPYVNVDPDQLVSTDFSTVYLEQMRRGEDALRSAIPSQEIRRETFLAQFGLSRDAATLVRDLGFRGVVLTPASQTTTANGASFLADPSRLVRLTFGSGTIDAALADPALATTMTSGSLPGADPYLAAQHLLAELKAMRTEVTGRGESTRGRTVVLTTLDGSPPSPELLTAMVNAMSTEPDIVLLTLDDAMATTDLNATDDGPIVLELADTAAGTSGTWADLENNLRTRIESFAAVLPDGDVRIDMWRGLLEVIRERSMTDDRRSQYIEAVRVAMNEIARSISLPSSTTFTLGGRDSSIRVTLRNDSDADLTVQIRLTSSKLRFPERSEAVVLPAGTTTAVEVSVEARSNGRFPVVMQLFTPDGSEALGPAVTFTARVNALAGLGQLVTGIALLLLISWWIHHLRTERRRRFAAVDDTTTRHPSIDRSAP